MAARAIPLLLFLFTPLLTPTVVAAPAPINLALRVSPYIVDVGKAGTFVVDGKQWPAKTSVTLSFVSPHHGFTGKMRWGGSCGCFDLAVSLARRSHALEQAHAVARITWPGGKRQVRAAFMIRGLAKTGKGYSPGGRTFLAAWVSDPRPFAGQYEHFCGWDHTLDRLGVPHMRVRFLVRYPGKAQSFTSGATTSTGAQCVDKKVPRGLAKKTITVDVYSAGLHVRTTFQPSS